eukprot:1657019-Ditylum_brightwellii.AAC.1
MIPTSSGNRDLLTDFMQITNDDIKLSKANQSSDQNRAATNMYISLWKSLVCQSKPRCKCMPTVMTLTVQPSSTTFSS